jgi:hypothetical protein
MQIATFISIKRESLGLWGISGPPCSPLPTLSHRSPCHHYLYNHPASGGNRICPMDGLTSKMVSMLLFQWVGTRRSTQIIPGITRQTTSPCPTGTSTSYIKVIKNNQIRFTGTACVKTKNSYNHNKMKPYWEYFRVPISWFSDFFYFAGDNCFHTSYLMNHSLLDTGVGEKTLRSSLFIKNRFQCVVPSKNINSSPMNKILLQKLSADTMRYHPTLSIFFVIIQNLRITHMYHINIKS